MLKISFPTDFSCTANNAFIYALNCKELNAELVVLHVYSAPIIIGGVPPSPVDEVTQEVSLGALEEFNSKTPELHKIAHRTGSRRYNEIFYPERRFFFWPMWKSLLQNKGIGLLAIVNTCK